MHRFHTGLGVAIVMLFVAGCSATSAQQARTPTPAPADVVGAVGPTSITLEQVDEKALQMPAGNFGSMKLSQALYEARRAALEEIIADLMIDQDAVTHSVDRAAMIRQAISAKE